MKRCRVLPIIVLLLLAAGASTSPAGEPPRPDVPPGIEAGATAAVGELIRLRATGAESASYSWVCVPPTPDFEAMGNRAFLSSRMVGQFTVVLAVVTETGVVQVTHVITVGEGPPPDPFPSPLPIPGPKTKSLQVLMIEESEDRTPEHAKVILGPWRDWLENQKHPRPRVVDKDNAQTDLAPWIARAGSRLPYVFLVDTDGSVVHEGRMPETVAGMLELVKQYGAEK